MEKWLIKALVQKGISYLPKAEKINYLLQRYITFGKEIPTDFFLDRLSHFKNHLHFQEKYFNQKIDEIKILELGTGWHPIIPIAFFLAGAKNISSIDIRQNFNRETLRQTISKFLELYEKGKLNNYFTNIKLKNFNVLKQVILEIKKEKPIDVLEKLNIKIIITDARKTEIPENSIDYIISNNTMQDIPSEILEGIFKEFERIAKPNGISSHFIDFTDQFARFDKNITPYNYLKFSDKEWKKITNRLQILNRERYPFYKKLQENNGIKIEEEIQRKGNINQLKTIKLNEKYKDLSLEEIAVSHCHFVGRYK